MVNRNKISAEFAIILIAVIGVCTALTFLTLREILWSPSNKDTSSPLKINRNAYQDLTEPSLRYKQTDNINKETGRADPFSSYK